MPQTQNWISSSLGQENQVIVQGYGKGIQRELPILGYVQMCQLKVNYLLYPYIRHLVCINQQENIGEWGILMVFGVDLSFCHGAFLQDSVQPPLCTLPLPGIQGAP